MQIAVTVLVEVSQKSRLFDAVPVPSPQNPKLNPTLDPKYLLEPDFATLSHSACPGFRSRAGHLQPDPASFGFGFPDRKSAHAYIASFT